VRRVIILSPCEPDVKRKNTAKDLPPEAQGGLTDKEDQSARNETAERIDTIWDLVSDLNPY
jgi:hypothetical protein